MKPALRENVFKHILIIIALIVLYCIIKPFIISTGLGADHTSAGTVLVAVSIVAVTACFGNFAFKYEKININNCWDRCFAHTITGLLMLIIGISLIFTGILIEILMGSFFVIDWTLILLYLACIGYDFWDLRAKTVK